MNLKLWQRFTAKQLTQAVHPVEGSAVTTLLPSTRFDYENETREREMMNSAVAAPVQWVQRVFPEAPVVVFDRDEDGEEEPVDDHPVVDLLRRPNPFYSGHVMWMGIIADLLVTGNAYLIKVRSQRNHVVELWYAPQHTMQPRGSSGDDTVFIDHYEYSTGVGVTELPMEDVIHFRWGIDERNVRKGKSPLLSVLREVFTDNEAANYAASLLRNLGIPGVIVVPDEQGEAPSLDDRRDMERVWNQRFGRDNRGRVLVAGARMKVTTLSFSPQEMNLRDVRRIPEERISAALGVPAIVAGLGAGLDRSTFANFGEAREMAYENGIIPTQRLVGEDLTTQLLRDFEGEGTNMRVGFDLRNVRVLQEDGNKLAERAATLVQAGIWTRARALRAMGETADERDEVYLLPLNVVEAPATGESTLAPPPSRRAQEQQDDDDDAGTDADELAGAALAASRASGNGNGR